MKTHYDKFTYAIDSLKKELATLKTQLMNNARIGNL